MSRSSEAIQQTDEASIRRSTRTLRKSTEERRSLMETAEKEEIEMPFSRTTHRRSLDVKKKSKDSDESSFQGEADSFEADESYTEERKRDHPKKTLDSARIFDVSTTYTATPKRRGRPRKCTETNETTTNTTCVPSSKKKRGRPLKDGLVNASKVLTPVYRRKRKIGKERRCSMEEMAENILDIANAEKSLEITNFEPADNALFMDQWAIIDKLDPIPGEAPCNRYLVENVLRQDDEDGLYNDWILRCYSADYTDRLLQEYIFLEKMEQYKRSHLVLTACDMRIVRTKNLRFCYMITASRPGHCLSEVVAQNGPFSDRDASRISTAILEIFENISKMGYVLLDVDLSHFSLDTESGRVYLSNCTNVVPGHERHGISVTFTGQNLRWRGGNQYAPLVSVREPGSPITVCDSLESILYLIFDLFGQFSFEGTSSDVLNQKKESWHTINTDFLEAMWTKPLVTCWLNLLRARRFCFDRSDSLKNGFVMKREQRELPRDTAIPTASYIDYCVFYNSLMLLEKFPGDEDDMPWDFALLEPDQLEILLIGEINRLNVKIRQHNEHVEAIEKREEIRLILEKQQEEEIRRNEKSLAAYLASSEGRRLKNEPLPVESDIQELGDIEEEMDRLADDSQDEMDDPNEESPQEEEDDELLL